MPERYNTDLVPYEQATLVQDDWSCPEDAMSKLAALASYTVLSVATELEKILVVLEILVEMDVELEIFEGGEMLSK